MKTNNTTYLLLAMILIGMFLVWYSTKWGAGLISDTFQYIASTRSLVTGNGLSIPYGDGELESMTKYPPMFPIILAIFEFGGTATLQNARFFNIFLFGVNIFLVFISTYRLTHSHYFSLLASALFSFSIVLIEVHSWALSEPLYLCLGLCAFLLVEKYFGEPKRDWLIVASAFASCIPLTRYVGLSLVLAVVIVILLNNLKIKQKLIDALLFGCLAVLPTAIWTLRAYIITQTLNGRMIEFHPLSKKNYVSAIDVILEWFIPQPLVEGNEKWILILTAMALAAIIVYWLRFYPGVSQIPEEGSEVNKNIVVLHGIYILAYGAMIIVSKTWVDPDIGLSDRILSPILVSLIILFVAFLSLLWNVFGKTRIFVALISLVIIAYYVTGTYFGIQRFHQGGIGIARRGWHRSEVVQALRNYSSYSIYTNSNSSLYLWSDRAGYGVKDFELLKEKGANKNVLLVIFHHVPPTGERLNRLVEGLELVEEDQIVSIYEFNPSK